MFREDVALKRYLDGLASISRVSRKAWVEDYFGFVGFEPTKAIEWQKQNPGDYRFVDSAYKWLEEGSLAVSSKQTKMGCVRGFFLANRTPLPNDHHRFHSDKTPVLGELSVDEFRQIVFASNPTYAASSMVQFQSGSGCGELCYINEFQADYIWDEIRKGKQIIRINLPGRKASRNIQPYYTFIGGDSIDLLKRLFHRRGWKKDTVLFRTERGDPITAHSIQSYFRAKALKLGLIKAKTPVCVECGGETVRQVRFVEKWTTFYVCVDCGHEATVEDLGLDRRVLCGIRYRMRSHELRDLFRTEWHRAQSVFGVDGDAGEFFMGHSIDPLKYDKIMRDKSFGLEQYRRAMPMLNILSEDPRKIKRSEVHAQLEASEAKADAMAKRLAELERVVKKFQHPKILEVLEREAKKQ